MYETYSTRYLVQGKGDRLPSWQDKPGENLIGRGLVDNGDTLFDLFRLEVLGTIDPTYLEVLKDRNKSGVEEVRDKHLDVPFTDYEIFRILFPKAELEPVAEEHGI